MTVENLAENWEQNWASQMVARSAMTSVALSADPMAVQLGRSSALKTDSNWVDQTVARMADGSVALWVGRLAGRLEPKRVVHLGIRSAVQWVWSKAENWGSRMVEQLEMTMASQMVGWMGRQSEQQ